MIRIVICDVHSAVLTALSNRITSVHDQEVVAETVDAQELPGLIEQLKPDVVVLELAQQRVYGLDLIQQLASRFPDLQILVYSMYDPHIYAERAIRAGAGGFVSKTEPTDTVVTAVRSVVAGEIYLEGSVASDVLRRIMRGTEGANDTDDLTDRELAVVQLIGEGHDLDSIADMLSLSRKTIETYRRRARKKLGFASNEELISYAVRQHHV